MIGKKPRSGFTLVSLAIVLVIVGFILGIVIKGEQILRGGRLKATISQMQYYKAAFHQFKDKYKAYPGDMEDATSRVRNCDATTFCQNGNGDRIIGVHNSGMTEYPFAGDQPSVDVTGAGEDRETRQFWLHLFVSGILTADITPDGQVGWGRSQPYARVGGGYELFFNATAPNPGGHWLLLRKRITTESPFQDLAVQGVRPLNQEDAAFIDRSIDDGAANLGYLQAGPPPLCANGGVYDIQDSKENCNIFYYLDRL